MAQIFHPSTNAFSRASLFGAVLVVALLLWAGAVLGSSSYTTGQDVVRQQPIQFSHAHHVGLAGIDCRYCHVSVETSWFAGIPSLELCMHCHANLYTDAPLLEPLRQAWRSGEALAWNRVHDLPDFSYFDHSAHVSKGIGCATCHGRVDEMPLVYQAASLQMQWCLDCHRDPGPYVRPPERLVDMAFDPATLSPDERSALFAALDPRPRTSCSTCHR